MARTEISPLPLSPPTAAYIAGLIDGEGCIGINKVTRPVERGYPSGFVYRGDVSVTMTTPDVLYWMQRESGVGQVNPKKPQPNRQDTWTWRVGSRQGSCLLVTILPHLRVKHLQAINFIAFQDACRHTSTKYGLTEAEYAAKADHYEISRFLNRRGVGHPPPSAKVQEWLAARA